MASNPRYFGANPGYFSGSGCLIVQLWHPESGLLVKCVDESTIADELIASDLSNEDINSALGENYQACAEMPHVAYTTECTICITWHSYSLRFVVLYAIYIYIYIMYTYIYMYYVVVLYHLLYTRSCNSYHLRYAANLSTISYIHKRV